MVIDINLNDVASEAALNSHIGNNSNPHAVTKSQVGLGNVDNTSDVNKPVSTAQQTAIDAKVAQTITNGVTTSAPSQNAVFDALALKTTVYGDNNIAENHTGDTNEFLLNYFIEFDPAIDIFGANDWLECLIGRNVNNNTNTKILRVYIGPTSGTLVGASLVIYHNCATSGALTSNTKRTLRFNNSLVQLKVPNLANATMQNSNSDETANHVANATPAVNFAITQYMMFTVQNQANGDSSGLDSVEIKHLKPSF